MNYSHSKRRKQSKDLNSKLCEAFINELQKDFYQSSSKNALQFYENSLRPSEIHLQGGAADGFLIDGSNKSDVDFLYTINIFNPSLKFKKLISDPRSPGHVKIEIILNISECKTGKKDKLMTNIEHIDGQCFLNIQHIKHEISEKFNNRFNYCGEYRAEIKSEKTSCFRIQLDYDYCHVITNYIAHQIDIINEFSENILKTKELNEKVKKLFYNMSGNYFVNEFEWKKFQEKINFINEKNKTLKQEIIKGLNYYLEKISQEMYIFIKSDFWRWNFFIINEYCFYLLLLILMHSGLDTIVQVICDKIIILHQNNIRIENKLLYKDTVYFNKEEITKIINIDLNSILSEPITDQEENIVNIFFEFLEKVKIELKEIMKDKNVDDNNPKFSFVTMEDLNNGVTMKKLHWLSTMSKLIIQLLEYIKYSWSVSYYKLYLFFNQTIEIVPGLYFNDWPLIASDWVTRERYWPEPEIIQRIVNNGYHVVFKSLNETNGYDGDYHFQKQKQLCVRP